MADQFTQGQGQPTSGFTPQEEEAAVAFGLSPSEAGLMYQASAPTFEQGHRTGIGPYANVYAGPYIADSGQRKVVDAFVDLSNMGPDALTTLQHRLYDAGLYDASYYKSKGPKIHYGEIDDATLGAYKDLIVQSVRSNGKKTPEDILNEGSQKGYGKDAEQKQTPKPPPLTIQLTNPDDLLTTADTVARKLIGRKLTDQELRAFVDSFHSMEASAQQQKYQQTYGGGYDEAGGGYTGPGGTVVKPADPEAEAIATLRREHPDDVKNVEMEHGMDVFNSLLRGSGG